MARLSIDLVNGSSLDIAEEDWPELACASHGGLQGGAYFIVRLIVRGHEDGRLLTYAEEQVGAKKTTLGQLVGPSTLELETSVRALAGLRDLPPTLAEECLQQFADRRSA
jgi:hypothetical protein